MAAVDLADVKRQWIGVEFDHASFTIDRQRMLDWATACGETDPRFTDPDHPDFQAHPTYTAQFGSGRWLPDGFPQLGSGGGVDGGKAVEIHNAIRAGDVLNATSEIADIYEKTGRSGTMIFIVHRMVFANQDGEPVATVDWRMIRAAGR
jgi:hypothetical protein